MSPPLSSPAAGPDGLDRATAPAPGGEDLTVPLSQRAEDVATQQRLHGLLAANRSIVAELSLPKALQRLVEAARDTADARYAALAVLAPDGSLTSLVQSGMDEEVVARIRRLTTGAGLLGALTRLAARSSSSSGGRAAGSVAECTEAGTFLGVPIRAHGSVYGNLYVVDPVGGGRFSEEDGDLVSALAATAGIAVENARLYDESRRRQEWLLAASRISQRLLAADDDELEVWRLVAADVCHLADADLVALVVPLEGDDEQLQVLVAAGPGAEEAQGTLCRRSGNVADFAMRRGRGAVAETGQGYHLRFPSSPDDFVGPMMALPLKGEWGSRGAIVVRRRADQAPFDCADLDMAEDFAGQVAIALELADARAAQQRLGALEDRERIARDLHDHVIQRLFATGLTLQSTVVTMINPVVRERLGRTVAELDETIRQIRTSIFALKYSRPAVSSLRATALAVVEEATTTLGSRPSTRFSGPLDSLADEDLVAGVAVVLRELLSEVAPSARAGGVSVELGTDARTLTVAVADHGQSWQDRVGLAELSDRIARHGGELAVERPAGGGLRLTWSVPVT